MPKPLLALDILSSIWEEKESFASSIKPKCLCSFRHFTFRENTTSTACLVGSELKLIFH